MPPACPILEVRGACSVRGSSKARALLGLSAPEADGRVLRRRSRSLVPEPFLAARHATLRSEPLPVLLQPFLHLTGAGLVSVFLRPLLPGYLGPALPLPHVSAPPAHARRDRLLGLHA